MEELRYGLLGDKLVHIDDVEKGLACNCVCPYCKTQLVAKKGIKNARHFAHYKLADCNHGSETALHLMAKNIITQTRTVFVPFIPKNVYDFSKRGIITSFANVELEKQLSNNVRGDVVLSGGGKLLNVEIKVTHEVDLQKTVELFNLDIATIEIDLSDMKNSFSPEMVRRRILDGEKTRLISSQKNKDIFAKRILGEWKIVHNSKYVDDCPFSRKKAYFVDYHARGGYCQCHECWSFGEYDRSEDRFLCYEQLSAIDFSKIDEILHLEKEENHIRSVKLLMNDGSIVEKSRSNE